jgi:glycosyltransferase involved in cell wall biosynthesis
MSDQQTWPSVGIVIPCYQEKNYIEKCIRSCIEQSYRGKIHIVVVDGGSNDGTLEIIQNIEKEFPDQIVLKNNPLKVTPISLNIGLQYLQSDLKMILGAHSYLTHEYIEKSVQAFKIDPQLDCVGGIIINEYQDDTSRIIGMAMSSPFGVGNATFRTGGKKGLVDTVAFGMYKKEVFESIGYFNENLIRNQDDEFNFRLTQNHGKILFDPEIISHYYARGNYSKLFRQYFQYGFWKVYVNVLHHSVTSVRQLIPCFFVIYLICATVLNILVPQHVILWNIPIFLYLLVGIIAAVNKDFKKCLPILWTFFLLHLSYGSGYLKGIIQFGIFKQKAKAQHAKHNR